MIKLNNTELLVGRKQYINNNEIRRIMFNGVEVWQYDNVAPTITVTSSLDNRVNASYTLTGTVTDSASGVDSVKINGENVTLVGNTFSKAYTLSAGVNTFTIVATDIAGNSNSKTVTVNNVNQKNNASYNWSTTRHRQVDANSTNHHYYDDVYVGGTWYTYFEVQNNTGSGWVRSFLTIDARELPLPKGLKTATFTMRAYGAGGNSNGKPANGNWTITVTDKTTNTILANYSDRWNHESGGSNYGQSAITFTLNIAESVSTHNLAVTIAGTGNGWEYSSSSSGVGIGGGNTSAANGYSFTWY